MGGLNLAQQCTHKMTKQYGSPRIINSARWWKKVHDKIFKIFSRVIAVARGPWTSLVVRKNLEKFGHFSSFSPTDRIQTWRDICPASVFAETAGADCWQEGSEEEIQ